MSDIVHHLNDLGNLTVHCSANSGACKILPATSRYLEVRWEEGRIEKQNYYSGWTGTSTASRNYWPEEFILDRFEAPWTGSRTNTGNHADIPLRNPTRLVRHGEGVDRGPPCDEY